MSDAAADKPRRFPWALYWVLLALIGIFANLPVVTTVVSAAVADAYGCNISEGLLNPCVIGADYGSWLQFGGMSFLYLFLSWPIAFVIFIIWLMVLVIHRSRFNRRGAR